jgi:uncharacterized membrane protein
MATTMAATQGKGPRALRSADTAGRASAEGDGDAGSCAALLGGGALAIFGLTRGTIGGLGLAAAGGYLAYRGARSNPKLLSSLGLRPADPGIRVERSTTVNGSPDQLYAFWRDSENFPRFKDYLESVRTLEGNRSHWVARGPIDMRVEWDAELTTDQPGEQIAWRSLPGSAVDTEGSVRFTPAPGGRGTEVKVQLRYDPPGGKAGATVAALFGRSAAQEIQEDLRRFKRFFETGEIPTTRGQSSGRGRDAWEQTAGMVVREKFAAGLGWFGIGLGLAEVLTPEWVANLAGTSGHNTLIRLLVIREIASGLGILKQMRPEGWLWGRVAGDAMGLSLLCATLLSPESHKERTVLALLAVLGVTGLDVLCSLQHSCSPDTMLGTSWRRALTALSGNGAHRS